MVYSEKLVNELKKGFSENSEIELAMRYGNPSIEEGLLSLKNKNCRNLIILPMFPQYSGTTTGSPTVATGVSGKTILSFTGRGSYTV